MIPILRAPQLAGFVPPAGKTSAGSGSARGKVFHRCLPQGGQRSVSSCGELFEGSSARRTSLWFVVCCVIFTIFRLLQNISLPRCGKANGIRGTPFLPFDKNERNGKWEMGIMNQPLSSPYLPAGGSQPHTRYPSAKVRSIIEVPCPMTVTKSQQSPAPRPRKKRRRPWLGFITPTTSTCGRNWGMLTTAVASSNGFVMRGPFPCPPAPRPDTEWRGVVEVRVLRPVSLRPARIASVTARAARLLDSEGRLAKGDTRRTRNR